MLFSQHRENQKQRDMDFYSALISFLIALIITVIFFYGFRSRGPWGNFWTFFLVMFLVIWAGALWLTPIGPTWLDVAWVPIIILGIVLAIIMAASTPPERPTRIVVNEPEPEPEREPAIVGMFFWVSIIVLAAVIIYGIAAY